MLQTIQESTLLEVTTEHRTENHNIMIYRTLSSFVIPNDTLLS